MRNHASHDIQFSHQDVIDYLALGFVPSAILAQEYLEDIFDAKLTEEDSSTLLRHILDERVYKTGHRRVILPLSGGMDSRSILGALLDILEAKDIHCVTVGTENLLDYKAAAATCQRLGVSHERIDPDSLEWNLEHLQDIARKTFKSSHCRIPVDAFVMFGAMATISDDTIILSGYLGDAVSGKHLPHNGNLYDPNDMVAAFLSRNNGVPFLLPSSQARATIDEKAREWAPVIKDWRGATVYDILDFGFRQRHRIKGAATGLFTNVLSPFEDPRWLAHWFNRPLEDRQNQSAYQTEMRRAFPTVFAESRPNKLRFRQAIRRKLVRLVPPRVWMALRNRYPRPILVFENRGHPKRNPSMEAAMRTLLQAFDERQLIDQVAPMFDKFLNNSESASPNIYKWTASAELHIRAGNF